VSKILYYKRHLWLWDYCNILLY